MGSSFTHYGARGFWSRDAKIEFWLGLLALEAEAYEPRVTWLLAAAEDWRRQATLGFNGCVSAKLDEVAATPERRDIVLDLVRRGFVRLRSQGETLSSAWLNSVAGGPVGMYEADVPAENFVLVGEALRHLLRGEVVWDASTSPVL